METYMYIVRKRKIQIRLQEARWAEHLHQKKHNKPIELENHGAYS